MSAHAALCCSQLSRKDSFVWVRVPSRVSLALVLIHPQGSRRGVFCFYELWTRKKMNCKYVQHYILEICVILLNYFIKTPFSFTINSVLLELSHWTEMGTGSVNKIKEDNIVKWLGWNTAVEMQFQEHLCLFKPHVTFLPLNWCSAWNDLAMYWQWSAACGPLSLSIYMCVSVCAFFQDDASSVLHSPAVRVEAAGGLALVPGYPGHPDLLPGKWRMELPADFRQDSWQRFTVSMEILNNQT